MNKKNLFATTAFTTLAIASLASAETKISGDIENTFSSSSEDGINSYRGFGTETNVIFSSSKDLDNGLTAKYGFKIEGGNSDTRYLTVGTDTVSFSVADDNGNNLSSSALPHIGDQIGTVVSNLGGGSSNSGTAIINAPINPHNFHHASLDINAMGGTVTARYTPSNSARRNINDSDDSGSSMQEYLYSGSLGVDGLKVIVGMAKEEATNESIATTETGKYKKGGISYNFGQFAVGVEKMDFESAATTATQDESDITKAGITFAASDTLSLGLQYAETERKSGGTKYANDEEVIMASIGYNFGGLGIQINYADVEHVNNAAATDAEVMQIRTIQKF